MSHAVADAIAAESALMPAILRLLAHGLDGHFACRPDARELARAREGVLQRFIAWFASAGRPSARLHGAFPYAAHGRHGLLDLDPADVAVGHEA